MSATSTPASGSRSPGRASRQQRQRHIVDHVLDKGYASAAELVSLTGVSLMTVHRDLDDLAARGVLRKYHGGVSAQPSTVFESSSDFRLHAHPEAKEALGRAAACFVNPGMSVMLDDSTTALALARHLAGVGPLTVVTNYRQAMELLREEEDIRLIGLGGEYSRTHDSFGGLACQEAVNGLNVDLVFQSTSAMNDRMTFHQEQEIVLVKRAMMGAGAVKVLLMDASKVGRTALHQLAPIAAFDHVLLSGSVDPDMVAAMSEHTDVRLIG